MKKLMIAAAAAAMIGGAYAAGEKYVDTGKKAVFDDTQIIVLKQKAWTDKAVNLNTEKFGKTTKYKDEAVDGVVYYDYDANTNGIWKAFSWSKAKDSCSSNTVSGIDWVLGGYQAGCPIFVDNADTNKVKKAIAAVGWVNYTDNNTNAETYVYAPLKVKKGAVDDQIKSIKFANSSDVKVSVKTYKNKEARDKAVKTFWTKYEKALKKAK